MKNRKGSLISKIQTDIKKALFKHKNLIGELNINLEKVDAVVEKTRDLKFGDYSSNVAMSLNLKKEDILRVANAIKFSLSKTKYEKIEVVGPGFINVTLNKKFNFSIVNEVNQKKQKFGKQKNKKLFYNIEFVSANPTGLLHIGHARNAAIGDSLARIWKFYGIKVNKEYYLNDAGNQINKLALSTLIRYLQLCDKKVELPEDSYHGEEIINIAKEIFEINKKKFIETNFNTEKITDKNVEKYFINFAKEKLLEKIKKSLFDFGVEFDIWFPESFLYENNLVDKTINSLKKYTYEQDGALWLKTTLLGDDKDRVLKKADGSYTYFAPDIAYHDIKLSRDYNKIFNVWGSDHASYSDRVKIAMKMLGYKKRNIVVLIMQMVRLVKDGEEFKMSKRTGNSLTLDDLLQTMGKNAARWFLLTQPTTTHLEIDVNKATSKTNDNPLFYVQYAHARINQLEAKGEFKRTKKFNLLTLPVETEIVNQLHYFVYTIENIVYTNEPSRMILFLQNLAKIYHSYYANNKIIDSSNQELSRQRYWLSLAVKQVLGNGMKLLGVDPMEKM